MVITDSRTKDKPPRQKKTKVTFASQKPVDMETESRELATKIVDFVVDNARSEKVSIIALQTAYLSIVDHYYGRVMLIDILEDVLSSIKGPDAYKAEVK